MRVITAHAVTASQSKKAPGLVLLHGWGLSYRVWQPVLSALTPHYRVILIDIADFGAWQLLLAQLAETVTEPALWMGWSMGGLVALQMAAQYPHKVQRLITIGCNPCFVQRPDWPHAVAAAELSALTRTLKVDRELALRRFMHLLRASSDTSSARDFLRQQLMQHAPSGAALLAGLRQLQHCDLRQLLSHVQCPVRQVIGAKDRLVPVAALQAAQTYFTEQAPIDVVPDAGHMPFLSAPQTVHHWLREVA